MSLFKILLSFHVRLSGMSFTYHPPQCIRYYISIEDNHVRVTKVNYLSKEM